MSEAGAPLEHFDRWYAEARQHPGIADASAMSLATADARGRVAVRMVLLKQHDQDGFVFYTNLHSPKAAHLQENPFAALCFHWAPQGRQVRIEGAVEPVSAAQADAYFATRPRLSQLGAWASEQSTPMPHRFALEVAVAKVAAHYGAGPVPRPPHWSGFRVRPTRMEFWREGAFRHHERIAYVQDAQGWRQDYLFP